jgi:hypothetical protein
MTSETSIALHEQIEVLPSAGLLTSWLANYWLGKAFNAGKDFMLYKKGGTEDVDLKFLDNSNDGINHVYGFDKFEVPSVAFLKYVDAYIFCVIANRQKAQNAPYDTVRSLEESAQWRKDFVPKPQQNDEFDGDVMSVSEKRLLEVLTNDMSKRKQADTKEERIEVVEYVVAEIAPRLTLSMTQIDKDRGFADGDVTACLDSKYNLIHETYCNAVELDRHMGEEDQERLLGFCHRNLLTDEIDREGLRGTYAIATSNLKRAMYNDEQRRELGGIYFDTMSSWVQLMRLGRPETEMEDTS